MTLFSRALGEGRATKLGSAPPRDPVIAAQANFARAVKKRIFRPAAGPWATFLEVGEWRPH